MQFFKSLCPAVQQLKVGSAGSVSRWRSNGLVICQLLYLSIESHHQVVMMAALVVSERPIHWTYLEFEIIFKYSRPPTTHLCICFLNIGQSNCKHCDVYMCCAESYLQTICTQKSFSITHKILEYVLFLFKKTRFVCIHLIGYKLVFNSCIFYVFMAFYSLCRKLFVYLFIWCERQKLL